jgi:hypothetical protein
LQRVQAWYAQTNKPYVIEVPDHEADHRRAQELWEQGYTQSAIAAELGLSRQRISQWTVAGYFGGERQWVAAAAAPGLGISQQRLWRWAKDGVVRRSDYNTYFRPDIEATVKRLRERPCQWRGCSNVVDSVRPRARLCPLHQTRATSLYARSEKNRANFIAAVVRWQKEHPERTKYINDRAKMVYKLTKKGMSREEARQRALEKYP